MNENILSQFTKYEVVYLTTKLNVFYFLLTVGPDSRTFNENKYLLVALLSKPRENMSSNKKCYATCDCLF